jgi:AraC-like DNA-binding protein
MWLRHEGFRRLCLARELLRECDGPSIAAVARQLGVSRFHFIRQFDSVFGATPQQFRIGAKLERARHLLATTDRSVTDVCMDVGFSSLGTFSTLFRRRMGESPSAYRRRLRTAYAAPAERIAAVMPGCLSLMGAQAGRAGATPPQFSRSHASSERVASQHRGGLDANQAHEHHG